MAVAGDVFDGVFLCCPFSPRDVLDEVRNLIESVSEGFPTYSHSKTVLFNYTRVETVLFNYTRVKSGEPPRNCVT